MKNLIRKELKLSLNPQVIIFSLLSALVVIPDWPSVVAFLYPLAGISTIFPRALADQDIQYTAMLPIRKGDVVKSKWLLVMLIELASLVLSIPFALVKNLVIIPQQIAQATEADAMTVSYAISTAPCFSTYAFILLGFAIYNLVLFPWYYRNPAKVNWPQTISLFIGMIMMGIGAAVQGLVPMFHAYTTEGWIAQMVSLGIGILAFAGLSILGEKLAEKHFDKVDL
jgi:hypothetical protein